MGLARFNHTRRVCSLFAVLSLSGACGNGDDASNREEPVKIGPSKPNAQTCVDEDGDGFGRYCADGPDCDDGDDSRFDDCPCFEEREGCGCEQDAPPQECELSSKQYRDGVLLCATGVRYCRDGIWTDCIGTAAYSIAH